MSATSALQEQVAAQPKTGTRHTHARRSHALTPEPLWYKDAIIYELHVKAFYDSVDDGVGDFPGLMQRLDYLQDLGVTALWLLPFYPSPQRDDGYDIADYCNVHPPYGTLRDFRRFVREAHRRGMRVITELVVNHTSDQHPWFQRARQALPGSPERDFYVWSDTDKKYHGARIIFTDSERSNWEWDPVAKAYYWHRFFHHQPDLNYDNPRVLREIIKVLRFWLDLGVDGLRLDAVPYLIEREGTNCENLLETHAILKRLRREVDQNYCDRMLLAESNQWPTDVRPYFGDGDECHMAFHFPLMPRIFMAVRQEDRHPITDILRQTPAIPDNCQWALFLRNHDELTLEMVTDSERDYMYKEYAADPKMRVNIGIRRRLAPLMDYSRRRIELLHSLLFSLPGAPVIYYGDEIGMGDNIYLGDRNGVRTPMQWTGDRNGGFSRAEPAKLYHPVIMDPISGYQAVNVEAQQRSPSSLLNWMKQMIALRKRHVTFSRGSIEFLHPANRKVLAYVRNYEDETILCVANLSRFVQPAELDLSGFKGMTPIEMIGHTEFPRIGELPYFLTLGPHAFYWFLLKSETAPITLRTAPEPKSEPVVPITVTLSGEWHSLLAEPARSTLEQSVILQFFAKQRWFAGKARQVARLQLVDTSPPCRTVFHAVPDVAATAATPKTSPEGTSSEAALDGRLATAAPEMPLTFFTLVDVHFTDGAAERYFLPLAVSAGAAGEHMQQLAPASVLARLTGPHGDAVLYDAIAHDGVADTLLHAIASRGELVTQAGTIRAFQTSAFDELHGQADSTFKVTRGAGGTSNSFVNYGARLCLKLFRKLEPGLNPDIEVGCYLTDRTSFRRIPRTAGGLRYLPAKGEPIALAVLQELVNHEGSGWEHAVEEVGRFLEWGKSQVHLTDQLQTNGRSELELARSEPPALAAETIGVYLGAAETLGRRTAEMHLALAGPTDDPAFLPEPLSEADLAAFTRDMQHEAWHAFEELQRNLDRVPEPLLAYAQKLLADRQNVTDRLASLATRPLDAVKIRIHGDYHLGQVLRTENDFVILDFEGEPARPLAERRAKHTPLKDIAGMIRSFSYAGYAALFAFTQDRPDDFTRLEPWVTVWRNWTAAAFVRSYLETAGPAAFLPSDERRLSDWLQGFVLEKACYELVYELNNRPTWLRIPLVSILARAEQERKHSAT
jgi:maltose alpha-D-glucosyltransferase/alpha-amylase